MAVLHDLVTELAGNGSASTAIAVLGILIVTAFVAVVAVMSMSRLDADPRSHPRSQTHRARHLVRH